MSDTRTLFLGRGECLSLSESESSSESTGAVTTGPEGAAPLKEGGLKKRIKNWLTQCPFSAQNLQHFCEGPGNGLK